MTSKIIRDSGWSPKIKRLLKGATVTVGLHEDDSAREDDSATNAMIGFWHEFGTKDVPARSFLRSTADKKSRAHKALISKIAAKAVRNELPMEHGLGLFGMKVASDVKEKIRSHIQPPLKDSTIAAKGSTTPLIDTGQLINAIDHEVRTGV